MTQKTANIAFTTNLGKALIGDSIDMLNSLPDSSVNLVITSPPFALQRKKEYGNAEQHEYIEWLSAFAKVVHKKLRDDGSFVLDIGGAYQKGTPARSLYNFRVAINFCDEIGFFLAQDFYWYNPSKLPSPIEWVNKRKLRAKDSINNVWWFSKSEWPKADTTKVLVEYSDRMKKLLVDPESFYSPAKRPSGHDIGKGFGKDNGGAIPSNLLQISNSESNGQYLRGCKAASIKGHPARFPAKLPEFFIKMLTSPGDLVVDIFGGSSTTGQVAEAEGRQWITCDLSAEYVAAGAFRFMQKDFTDETAISIYNSILAGKTIDMSKVETTPSKSTKKSTAANLDLFA